MNRAQRMLRVLADGKPHSRQEILRAADTFFLTNNAASELRKLGHTVERTYEHGEPIYRLVGALNAVPAPPVGLAPGDDASSPASSVGTALSTPASLFDTPQQRRIQQRGGGRVSKAMCGRTSRGFSGETYTCDRRDGHEGLHAEHIRLRDGYVSKTEWGSDGLAPHATRDRHTA